MEETTAADEYGTLADGERPIREPTLLTPVREHERIASLDVLRGFALLGILFVNMQMFAMPFGYMITYHGLADGAVSEKAAWWFVRLFCEYKFISLFSLLFGAGMALQMARAARRQARFVPNYLRRLGVLALFGALHGAFIRYGDILFIYAMFGLLLLLMSELRPKTLLIVAICVLGGAILVQVAMGTLQLLVEPPAAVDEAISTADATKRGFEAMMEAQFDPADPIWMNAELHAYRDGPWADAMVFRLMSWFYGVLFALLSFGWHAFALFLVGAAMAKANFFAPHQGALHRRAMILGLGIGFPLELFSALMPAVSGFEIGAWIIPSTVLHEIGSAVMCIGYVGAVCMALRHRALQIASRPLAAVGRMALTAYLLESLIATYLMYWWGLGWFGGVTRAEQIGIALGIYAANVVIAVIWLSIFRFGPFEWLWRSLTYLRPQPILRATESER